MQNPSQPEPQPQHSTSSVDAQDATMEEKRVRVIRANARVEQIREDIRELNYQKKGAEKELRDALYCLGADNGEGAA